MKQFRKLSETEMAIMMVLWQCEEPMTTAKLLSYFAQYHGKNWKIQTLSTFLTRLNEKGLVQIESKGKANLYRPALTRQAYEQAEAKGVLDTLYAGSIKNFLAALSGGENMSTEDMQALKEWLAEK